MYKPQVPSTVTKGGLGTLPRAEQFRLWRRVYPLSNGCQCVMYTLNVHRCTTHDMHQFLFLQLYVLILCGRGNITSAFKKLKHGPVVRQGHGTEQSACSCITLSRRFVNILGFNCIHWRMLRRCTLLWHTSPNLQLIFGSRRRGTMAGKGSG